MEDFEQKISLILSKDKLTREQGEIFLKNSLEASAQNTAFCLVSTMSSGTQDVKGLAAVLFRNKFLEENYLNSVPRESQLQLKALLLELMNSQNSTDFLKKLADVLVNLACLQEWSYELLGIMGQWAQSSLKEVTLYLFELATEYEDMMLVMKQNAGSVMSILWNALQDSNYETKLAAAKTICSFLVGLGTEEEVLHYAGVLDHIVVILTEALQQKTAPEHAIEALVSLSELTNAFPRVWKFKVELVTKHMCEIAKNINFVRELRSGAVEVVVTLVSRAPGLLKSSTYFIQEVLCLGMQMMTELDNAFDLEAWNLEGPESQVVLNEPFSLGKDLLSRLACYLEESMFTHAMQIIQAHLDAEHWARKHSGILALGMIADGCKELLKPLLSGMFPKVLSFCFDENPRLVWAGITCLGLLCSEFEPELQRFYHPQIVPAILNGLKNPKSKVQTQAASCMINYCKGLLIEDNDIEVALVPYFQGIILNYHQLLTTPSLSFYLLKELLNSLAIIIGCSGSRFSQYYEGFKPGIRSIIQMEASHSLQKEVRASCVKCIGCIVEAFSEEEYFQAEAEDLLLELMNLRSRLCDTDPGYQAIYEVISSFAVCLKDRFAPYLEAMMPQILQQAQCEVDFKFNDATSAECLNLGPGMSSVEFDLRGLGRKQLAISTTALENKTKAVKVIYEIVTNLGELFQPFVEKTIFILCELYTLNYSSEIRKYSLKTLSGILTCTKDNSQKDSLFLQIVSNFLKSLLVCKNSTETKRQLKTLLSCFSEVKCGSVVGLAIAHNLAEVLSSCVKSAYNRKLERVLQKSKFLDPDIYSEELEELEIQDETDEAIMQKVMEIVGFLLKGFKTQFQQIFLKHFKELYGQIFQKQDATDNEVLWAICIFDDYLEFTGDLLVDTEGSALLNQFLKFCYHSNSDIRQSAAYGLGLAAQFGDPSVFQSYLIQVCEALHYILSLPNAKSKELLVSSECAVGALAKVALFHKPDLVPEWLSWMPFKSDPEEARAIHSLFVKNIANLKKLEGASQVLAALANSKKEYMDEETWNMLPQAFSLFQINT